MVRKFIGLSLVLLSLLSCSLVASAQDADFSVTRSNANIIKYLSENKLYKRGDNVTVTNIDMEWSLSLDGDGMANLQTILCHDVLCVNASTLQDGLVEFHKQLGEEITHMPDSVRCHYINIKLEELWIEHGRYVSFYLMRQETNQKGKQLSGVKKFMTYDLVNNDTLETNKVFRPQYDDEESYYNRVAFESLIERNNVCDDDDRPNIDLTLLPQDFALYGNSMFFGLGGAIDHENFASVSLANLYALGMLKNNFIRWYQGKGKKKSSITTIANDFDSSLSTDSLSKQISKAASFPGGLDSLASYLKQNVEYPAIDMTLHNQGRVVVAFNVEKDGTLSDLTVIKSLTPGLDREAVRVIRNMPKWQPALRNDKPVRVRMTLPITYKLRAN